MNLSDDDVAYVYARACRAWYGQQALDFVRKSKERIIAEEGGDGLVLWEKIEHRVSGELRD